MTSGQAAATGALPPGLRLPMRLKITHGFGSIAYGLKENGFSTFLLLFYNQVIGLDAGLVGTAIMVALIADAFVDPVIGELSDRTQSRWGRRLPWLYGAPVPLAIAWVLLWNPPEMGHTMTIVWLVGFAIIVRSLVSMCVMKSATRTIFRPPSRHLSAMGPAFSPGAGRSRLSRVSIASETW